jgi:hypothetical protein
MKNILLILSLFIISCGNNAREKEHAGKEEHNEHEAGDKPVLQLNQGAKWTSDEATRTNVRALMQIVDDSSNAGFENRDKLTSQLRTAVDTLVQQCKMKGPDHDALHVWLENVLNDLKQLQKASEGDYPERRNKLRDDIAVFYDYFN